MQTSDKPQVYVIVLNWNNFADTKECLCSLGRTTYPNLRIIVVDNGSTDGSGKRLGTEFPEFQFILNPENLGFSRGCNVGIRAALNESDCGYVVLLNNDAVATPRFLEKAVEAAEANPQIGLVGGKVLYSPESRKIWYAGGKVSRWRGQVVIRGFRETDQGQYDAPVEVGFVTGALMLIRRAVLEQVGLLPEEYFFGTEEIDYSLAVRRAGYKLYYVPEFLVYHEADGSHSNYDPKFVYNNYRGKLILQEKYLPRGLFALWKAIFAVYGRHVARRVWQKIRDEDPGIEDKRIPLDDLNFAFRAALKDHGKAALSEDSLLHFERALRTRKHGV
jgi:GT2 family glycosyltransferase